MASPASPASPAGRAAAGYTRVEWLHALLDLLGSGRVGTTTGLRQCPAHRDSSPSLSLAAAEDGRVLLHCYAGCATDAVLEAMRCSWTHLHRDPWLRPEHHYRTFAALRRLTFPPVVVRHGHPAAQQMNLVGRHQYGDRWVLERWRHPTTGAKALLWETRRNGVLIPGLFGVPVAALPLYREAEVRMAVAAGEPVVVVESESSVDALCAAGVYATTWAGGASAPNTVRLTQVLAGADVVLVPDSDPAGLECGRRVWSALRLVAQVHYLLPECGEDARDLLAARGPEAFVEAAR